MDDFYTPKQVVEMFDVSNHALKLWRDPKRLKLGVDDPLYLPPLKLSHSCVLYSPQALIDFCRRNPRYADKLIALVAPANPFSPTAS